MFTPIEAHKRIVEAERGIAAGDVLLHEDVIRHSYELLEKKFASDGTLTDSLSSASDGALTDRMSSASDGALTDRMSLASDGALTDRMSSASDGTLTGRMP